MTSPHCRLATRACRFALCLAPILLGLFTAQAQYLRVYYPDIEQGSSTLVVSPSGHALLIDGGSGINDSDTPIEGFINDLIDAGIVTSLDNILCTHYDEDHIGRLENVYQYVPLGSGFVAYDRGTQGGTPNTFAYNDYAYWADQHSRTTLTPNTVFDLGGGVTVTCVIVNGQLPNSTSIDLSGAPQFENAASAAFLVSYGDVQLWIGGDLVGNTSSGHPACEQGAAPFVGDVDIYTCDHHGSSATSSEASFLATLKAEVAINQNSVENPHGHPNATVVQRFKSTLDTFGNAPIWLQTNRGDPNDSRSDDSLADGIADPDDITAINGQPGTITVLSDGGSYQVFGGAIEPVFRTADSGSHSLADFPPAILQTSYGPLVPNASETITVDAQIHDEHAISAAIVYQVNDVAQTPVAMSDLGGGHFQGTLPGQVDGAKLTFRVQATDTANQTSRSLETGFFTGVTPIATVRAETSGGVMQAIGYLARIRGTLTVAPGVFHPTVTQSYVQQSGSGINVFHNTLMTAQVGDLVELTGELGQFGGVAQIVTAGNNGVFGYSVVSSGSAPSPQVLTLAQLGEASESTLVRVNGLTIVGGTIPETGDANLDVTDDSGTTVRTLHIDGDTDIPGANTPSGSFDLIAVLGQYDSAVPLTSGYRLLPRARADFLSDEVNHPAVVIAEIHADPSSSTGDANGDGTVSSTQDEFVELVNTSYADVDISAWTLSDLTGVRFTFPANTVLPAREAAVVFGGGSPNGAFGNAAANGLVFVASQLGLNNGGDTLTLRDASSATVQVVTYGAEGGNDVALVRASDWSNGPFVSHLTVGAGLRYSPGSKLDGTPFTLAPGKVLLSEVMYDPTGSDTDLEWIELVNVSDEPQDLTYVSLGAGGGDYATLKIQLEGSIAPGETFVVGGPTSSSANGSPTFDQVLSFSLQNSGTDADGVALFNLRAGAVTATTVPIDAVIYGTTNSSGLLDQTGAAGTPDVGDAPSGASIERSDESGTWVMQGLPTPNASPLVGPVVEMGQPTDIIITEVMYDPTGSDNGLEWIELHNKGTLPVSLTTMSLGSGGGDYTNTKIALAGTMPAGATWVIGGDQSSSANGNPTYDLVVNFSPDLQNSGSVADGVALFAVPTSQITTSTVPIDAVIYGTSNTDNLIDESGSANAPEVGDAAEGKSIERTNLAGAWQIQNTPTPGTVLF